MMAMMPGLKVSSYTPENHLATMLDGWLVLWRYYTVSYVGSPGGEATQIRGTVLAVLKRLPDGNWKGFRLMGG